MILINLLIRVAGGDLEGHALDNVAGSGPRCLFQRMCLLSFLSLWQGTGGGIDGFPRSLPKSRLCGGGAPKILDVSPKKNGDVLPLLHTGG